MTTYTFNPTTTAQSVDWDTPADWLPQAEPNAADAVAVVPLITDSSGNPYPFSISIGATESIALLSLSVAGQYLGIAGTLAVGGAMSITEGDEIDLSGSLSVGSLADAGCQIQGSGQISSAGSFDNEGTIAGGSLTLSAAGFGNTGLLVATGGNLTVALSGALANLANGVLTGGTFEAVQGTLDLDVAGGITSDAATIILSTFEASPAVLETGAGSLALTLQTVAPGGLLEVENGSFTASQTLTVAGEVRMDNATLGAAALTIETGGTIQGQGTIAVPLTNDGTLILGQATTNSIGLGSNSTSLLVQGAVQGSGTMQIAPAGIIDSGPEALFFTLEVAGTLANAVRFNTWNGTLLLDQPAGFTGEVSGFTTGADAPISGPTATPVSDTIALMGLDDATLTHLQYLGTAASGTLSFDTAQGTVAIGFMGDYSLGDFVVQAGARPLSTSPPSVDISLELPCFLAGTRLLTARGEVAVERLAVGDELRVLIGGGTAPVRWIGQRTADTTRHPAPEKLWPVRIRAHAFGLGRPCRDLWLSPDHAVYLDGVLIPVRLLIDARMVVRERHARVHYVHVELPRHDVVLANGLPAESYLDVGNRAAFAAAGAPTMLYPDFSERTRDAENCAPLVLRGPALARARARLRAQAAMLARAAA